MMEAFFADGRKRVAVIGGGAAGMMAAQTAASLGCDVVIFEKNDRMGKKLRITGKGRCNVTNNCTEQEMLASVPTNPRFLYAALSQFSPADTMAFFEERGVPLKTERGRRVFPVSDKASDIVNALTESCRKAGVRIIHEKITSLDIADGRIVGVNTGVNTGVNVGTNASAKRYDCDAVIVCTGGKSYPMTGSDGDGYRFAREAGHHVTEIKPSLVPIVCAGKLCPSMQGLSLKNISFRIYPSSGGKAVYEDFGELMFTHFGLTGPVVLSASAHIPDIEPGKYEASIDFKPALDDAMLEKRILSDFAKYQNRDFINSLSDLLPQKAIQPIVGASGIDERKKVNSITKEERRRLCSTVKDLRIPLLRFRPIDEAIITKGGVAVNEINPKTMESKMVSGLYFAGEVLDLDAYTGGFNLQIAFSTAYAAGTACAYEY